MIWLSTDLSWLLLQNGFVEALLLFLKLLDHVVVNLFLLHIEDLKTILKGHLPLQVVMLSKELSISCLTTKLERCNVDALEALL